MADETSYTLPGTIGYSKTKYIYQSTPHRINRYVILIAYLLCLTCGCTYYSWVSLTDYLILGGKFEWVCTEDEIKTNSESSVKCRDQMISIHEGISLIKGVDFSVTFFASLASDKWRPNVMMIFGVFLVIIGWLIISFANSSIYMYLSFVIIGIASAMLYFPVLNIFNLFSDYGSSVISAIIAIGESISHASIFIMKTVVLYMHSGKSGFSTVTNCYVGSFLVICLFGAVICMPGAPFKDQLELGEDIGGGNNEASTNSETLSHFQKYMKQDTTKLDLLPSLLGAKLHLSAISLTLTSLYSTYFYAYFYEKYNKMEGVLNFYSILALAFPFIGIPIGIFHDKGYSHWILIIQQMLAFIACLLLKFLPNSTLLGYVSSLCVLPFTSMQETGLILYVENNYRAKYLSTLVSSMYTCGGILELLSLLLGSFMCSEEASFNIIFIIIVFNTIILCGLAYLYKGNRCTDESDSLSVQGA
ncbi:hypothetical protein BMR1_02g01030 [Babesia microti strain RI]|uniref:Uncharacterized protein n=1 Tax=Babesia microti (strain RI) TaxID=1133968 RepID=I7IQ06_BABMR|nr:hypothetical protein BMR1_02g01030 [Babesia microti strain RI]CCF73370.1 hypothetical protein BMR1_02g01030 [Babesia microti strain RI]|eukprot:XP_012647979.1 hypothetical protein BMR1_02g01030 [Babesia microti strain RI]